MEPDAPFRQYEEIIREGPQVDVLIIDAGQGVLGLFTDTDLRQELRTIQPNINSLDVLTKLFLWDMVQRNSGRILQLASIAAKTSTPYMAVRRY